MGIIDGKAISLAVKDEVRAEVAELEAKYGRKPCLCVIIVGENSASQVYVRNKVKAAEYTGMESREIALPESTSEEELLAQIKVSVMSYVNAVLEDNLFFENYGPHAMAALYRYWLAAIPFSN